jgi:hypothetical protein
MTWTIGALCLLLTIAVITSPKPPQPNPPSEQAWREDVNVEIVKTLVAKGVTGCGILRWHPGSRSGEFIAQCSMDNKTWTTWQVWTKINEVNLYGH